MMEIDHDAESRRMRLELAKLESPRVRIAIISARKLAAQKWKKSPNWVLAMMLFCHGSKYSRALCILHNIDPDATK